MLQNTKDQSYYSAISMEQCISTENVDEVELNQKIFFIYSQTQA